MMGIETTTTGIEISFKDSFQPFATMMGIETCWSRGGTARNTDSFQPFATMMGIETSDINHKFRPSDSFQPFATMMGIETLLHFFFFFPPPPFSTIRHYDGD